MHTNSHQQATKQTWNSQCSAGLELDMLEPARPPVVNRDDLERFLTAIYGDDTSANIRPVWYSQNPARGKFPLLFHKETWMTPGEVVFAFDGLYRRNVFEQANIQLAVDPRDWRWAKPMDDTTRFRALWVECNGASVAEIRARLSSLGFPSPSIIVDRGAAADVYWLLHRPVRVIISSIRTIVRKTLKGLSQALGAEVHTDVSKKLWLPGFWDVTHILQDATPVLSRLIHCAGDLRYDFSDFQDWLERFQSATPQPAPLAAFRDEALDGQGRKSKSDGDGRRHRAYDFGLASALLEAGYIATEIASIIRRRHWPPSAPGHFHDQLLGTRGYFEP